MTRLELNEDDRKVVVAALEVLYEQGFEMTRLTVVRIMKRIDTSKGLLLERREDSRA
jgi:hypothetical protein